MDQSVPCVPMVLGCPKWGNVATCTRTWEPKGQKCGFCHQELPSCGARTIEGAQHKRRCRTLWHFLAKPRTSRIVKICGKAVNQGGGLGIEVPCQYIFTRPDRLLERLEKCLDPTENPAVRQEPSLTRGNTKVKAGKKRKTTAKSDKDHEPLSRKKYWSDWKPMMVNGIH